MKTRYCDDPKGLYQRLYEKETFETELKEIEDYSRFYFINGEDKKHKERVENEDKST